MKLLQTLSELTALVGQEVVVSDWTTITQEQVNLFAQATGDHQWIHVDPERAAKEVAMIGHHGALTENERLIPLLSYQT